MLVLGSFNLSSLPYSHFSIDLGGSYLCQVAKIRKLRMYTEKCCEVMLYLDTLARHYSELGMVALAYNPST